MTQLQQGYDHDAPTTLRGLAYVAFQELATRIAHRNTGRYSNDPVADRIMVRIAADENLHMVFYRDILGPPLRIEPSAAVRAIVDEVLAFQMPGAGIPSFLRKAAQIAKAGIYDLRGPPRRGPDADPQPLADLRADRASTPPPRMPAAASPSTWPSSTRPPAVRGADGDVAGSEDDGRGLIGAGSPVHS